MNLRLCMFVIYGGICHHLCSTAQYLMLGHSFLFLCVSGLPRPFLHSSLLLVQCSKSSGHYTLAGDCRFEVIV